VRHKRVQGSGPRFHQTESTRRAARAESTVLCSIAFPLLAGGSSLLISLLPGGLSPDVGLGASCLTFRPFAGMLGFPLSFVAFVFHLALRFVAGAFGKALVIPLVGTRSLTVHDSVPPCLVIDIPGSKLAAIAVVGEQRVMRTKGPDC